MERRARITVELVEQGEDITLHFDGERFPPLWFNRRQRPTAHAKLVGILNALEIVEEIPGSLAAR